VFSVHPEQRTPYSQILTNHKLKLAKEVQICPPDVRELYLKEILLIERVEKAPEAKAGENKEEEVKMIGI